MPSIESSSQSSEKESKGSFKKVVEQVDSWMDGIKEIPEVRDKMVYVGFLTPKILQDELNITLEENDLSKYENSTDSIEKAKILDGYILEFINNKDISQEEKIRKIEKIQKISEDILIEQILKNINKDGRVINFDNPPINFFYVTNASEVSQCLKSLREIKNKVRVLATSLINKDANRLASYIPKDKMEPGVTNLVKVVSDNDTNEEVQTLAALEYLRLFREALNIKIAEFSIGEEMVSEQTNLTKGELRIGVEYSKERKSKTRRIANFLSLEKGLTPAKKFNDSLDGNYIAIDPKINELIEEVKNSQGEILDTKEIRDKLNPETITKLEFISNSGRTLTADDIKAIYEEFLKELNIVAYTAEVKATNVNGFDKTNKQIRIPENSNEVIVRFIPIIAHELTHLIQDLRRNGSVLSIIKNLTSLGRSSTLAEFGAKRNERIMRGLLGLPNNSFAGGYYIDMLSKLVKGGNFWEILDVTFKAIYDNDPGIKAIQSSETRKSSTAKATLRRLNRLYFNLGASGDKNREDGRYPTSLDWLSYLYADLPNKDLKDTTINGVPAHRVEELSVFFPKIMVGGKELDQSLFLETVINSVYKVIADT